MKQMLMYVKCTCNYLLCYEPMGLEYVGFVDADFARERYMRCSIMRYVFSMANGAMNWESKLQLVMILSMIEMKYITVAQACKEAT